MIRDREQKIIKEGEDARAVYAESTEWCEEPSNNDMSEIQTGEGNVADLQTNSEHEDSGAPETAMYASQSGGVVDTLNKLLEETQTHLDAARGKETASIQAFEVLKQARSGR